MMSNSSGKGLSQEQKEKVALVLVGFQSGNTTKDNAINRIADLLADRKTVSPARCADLENIFEQVGFDSGDFKPLLGLIKQVHKSHK